MIGRARGIAQRYPFAFGVGVSAVKTSAADYLAQTVVEGKKDIDKRRNFLFFCWGAAYLGGVPTLVQHISVNSIG